MLARDDFKVFCDRQNCQNERNRRSGKNRSGQGVLAFETQPQSEEGRKLGQDERQKEQRNQNDRLWIRQKTRNVELDSGQDEEERNQKAVSDRVQLLLRGFARRKKLDDDAGNERAQDVFCTDVFSQDDQSDDDCKRQTHVDLRS